MASLRLSFILFITLGFLCAVNCNPLSLFGKTSDGKAETEEKVDVATPSTAKSVGEATTTTTKTPGPSSSCGGLKGFLHICDKNEPTEPPKSVKTRSVGEEDDSDESDSDDDDDSDESSEKIEKKATETPPVVSDPTEGAIVKRQVGDPEAPVLGEVPPVLESLSPPFEPEENSGTPVKREAEDTDEDDDSTEEVDEDSRKRRDCRGEGDGDKGKDCRKKRELVPTCYARGCTFDNPTQPQTTQSKVQ